MLTFGFLRFPDDFPFLFYKNAINTCYKQIIIRRRIVGFYPGRGYDVWKLILITSFTGPRCKNGSTVNVRRKRFEFIAWTSEAPGNVVNSQCWALGPNVCTFGLIVITLGCCARGCGSRLGGVTSLVLEVLARMYAEAGRLKSGMA